MGLPSPMVAAAGDVGGGQKPCFELADVVRAYAAQYLQSAAASGEQRKVLRAIASCRTAALGGHVEQCERCSYQRITYHSCRNRHCPKCQGKETAQWMAAERAMLLPVPYFHVVFTLPHALNPLIRVNRRRLYALLFRAAAATLRTFALDPRHLGAEPAITMVLHTWGQTLEEHYHVHCVVSGGGLALDGRAWVALPRRQRRRPFLFPVKALSKVFRAKFIAALKPARRTNPIQCTNPIQYIGQSAELQQPAVWKEFINELRKQHWVVYSKPPFGGPEQVLKYLSRYTHRIAISNRRLLAVGNGIVRFEYRDYADDNQRKQMSLAATEFLRRFLLHVLPTGFMRIRHYGITANCQRQNKLMRCRQILAPTAPPAQAESQTTASPSTPTAPTTPLLYVVPSVVASCV